MGDVTGLTVLDAGCGEGIIARLLAERGAKVIAIDVSPRLVEMAKAQDLQNRVTYQVHDLSRSLPQYAQTFDVIVSNLVLNDVPDYRGFAATLGSMTKPGGRLVLSLNNPYSALMREKVQNYFDSGKAVLYSMAKEGVKVFFYHRTMEEYVTAFRDAGLLLRSLADVQMTEEMAARGSIPSQGIFNQRFPFFVVLEFIKPS